MESKLNNKLLWNPLVHKSYHEDLYYFALRFAPYKRNLYEDLLKHLSKDGINGVCLYEIFGEYDLLLRVWLVQSQLAEVYEIFRKLPTLVAYPPFRVKDVRHWAFRHEISDGIFNKLTSNPEKIRAIQKAARNGADESINEYKQEQIAYYGPISERRSVKFYTALSFGEQRHLSIQAENEIRTTLLRIHDEQMEADKPAIKKASIYWGEGFANVLIKGMSRDVVQVRHFIVDTIIPRLSGLFPTPTTFIVCEGSPHEYDDISERALNEFLTGTPPLWILSWFPDFYHLGADPTVITEIEYWLSLNYNNIRPLSQEFKAEVLKPLLQGIITGDSRIVIKALLPWFAEAELALKENWFDFLRAVGHVEGDALGNAEFEIRKTLGLLKESKKEIALGEMLNMHLEALKRYQPDSKLLSGKAHTAELTKIRNTFAHGDILRNLSIKWREILDLLLWFLPLYEGVLKLAAIANGAKEGE